MPLAPPAAAAAAFPFPFPPLLSRNATQLELPSLAHAQRQWPPGKGFWIGLAFFVCFIVIIVILFYSYLASPFWFVRLKTLMGFRPSKFTPISRRPLPVVPVAPLVGDLESSVCGGGGIIIAPPEPAHLSSRNSLPQYRPGSNFSNDVLSGLLDLNVPPGSRPPSYRSRLTLDVELMTRSSASRQSGQTKAGNET